MPKALTVPTTEAEAYPLVGEYRGDNSFLPHYNQSTTDTILPGEPVIKAVGTENRVMISSRKIEPLEVGSVHANWIADFPCILSADIKEGEAVYWDLDVSTDTHPVGVAVLLGDLVDGFKLGYATYKQIPGQKPTVDTGEVVCGTSSSSTVRVVYVDEDVVFGTNGSV